MVAAGWWFYLARRARAVATDLEASWRAIERNASRLIGVVALIAAIVAATFATRSAAGADASGYLSQAAMWANAELFHGEILADDLSTLNGWQTTPLGWTPFGESGAVDLSGGMQVPTYPPGLPLLMALPHRIAGIDGANAIVIASAAIAAWATGMIAGGIPGIIASLLLALSPVFLYQSFQPMSDVPVTAAWMLSFLLLARGKPDWLAGVACAVAVLIRPNLAPLAIIPLWIAHRKIDFALPVAVAGIFLGFLQMAWYGSPFQSGYGAASELFALANIGPNAARYSNWLLTTAPALLLAPFGFLRVRADRRSRALAVFAMVVIAAYLIYGVFDHWSYLRFLLPAMAVFAVFAAIALDEGIRRSPMAWRAPILVALVLVISAHALFVARAYDTFKLADQQRRVAQVAEFVRSQTPEGAVILSGEQSGSMRYYTSRTILRWEAATPETLSRAVDMLEGSGRLVYVVLDAWENEPFLAKFKTVPKVALNWPAMLEAGTSHRTRLWRVGDRHRFLAGENLQTIRLP